MDRIEISGITQIQDGNYAVSLTDGKTTNTVKITPQQLEKLRQKYQLPQDTFQKSTASNNAKVNFSGEEAASSNNNNSNKNLLIILGLGAFAVVAAWQHKNIAKGWDSLVKFFKGKGGEEIAKAGENAEKGTGKSTGNTIAKTNSTVGTSSTNKPQPTKTEQTVKPKRNSKKPKTTKTNDNLTNSNKPSSPKGEQNVNKATTILSKEEIVIDSGEGHKLIFNKSGDLIGIQDNTGYLATPKKNPLHFQNLSEQYKNKIQVESAKIKPLNTDVGTITTKEAQNIEVEKNQVTNQMDAGNTSSQSVQPATFKDKEAQNLANILNISPDTGIIVKVPNRKGIYVAIDKSSGNVIGIKTKYGSGIASETQNQQQFKLWSEQLKPEIKAIKKELGFKTRNKFWDIFTRKN